MKKGSFLFFTAFLLWAGASSSWAGEAIALRSAVDIRRPAIRLGDVFVGVPEEKDLDIALAPPPGKSVVYPVKVLVRLAEQFGLPWSPESLTDRCVLTRAAILLTSEKIGEKIIEKIKEEKGEEASDLTALFDGRFDGVFLPAEQDASFDLQAFDYDPQTRRFRAELVAASSAQQPIRQKLSGRVAVRREVPVLARRLTSGTVLGAGDIVWETVPQEKMPTDAAVDVTQIVGKELRRDQNEGEMLRLRDLIPPRLVARGSLVTMKVESPLMQITAQGRALQDGAKGEVVRVTNMQSNRTIEGVVESSGIVRVGGSRKMAAAE